MPLVSVVVPTHQRRADVQRAVASVLAQEFRSFEVVVIDNGSTDGTRETLAPLADGGLIRYHWQTDQGPCVARNVGIELARGELVAFLDSDDRWLPDHLSVICDMFARRPEAVLATTAPRFLIAGSESSAQARLVDPLPDLFLDSIAGHPSCTAVRRDALLAVNGFATDVEGREDIDLWMRLALRGPFCVLQRQTIEYDRSGGALVDRARREGRRLDAMESSTRRALAELARVEPPPGAWIRAQGQGVLEYIDALRALDAHDAPAAAEALRHACRLVPELSSQQGLVAYHLSHHLPRAHEPDEHLWHVAHAALAWPDPDSDTAGYLRLWAIVLALQRRRFGLARRLVASAPTWSFPRAWVVAAYAMRGRFRYRRGRPRAPARRAPA